MTTDTSSGIKGLLLVIGAFVVTIGVAICIITFAIMLLLETSNCNTMIRAMVTLWITIALVFISSVVLVRVVAWKLISSASGRLAVVVVYGVALLASYFFIAFGLMVAFNC